MKLRTLLLAATTAMSSPALSEPAPGATFDFQCVSVGADGEFRAEFEHFMPLTGPDGLGRTDVGNAIGRHSEILGPHSFSSDAATLQQLSEVHHRWLNDPSIGTPEQMFMINGELIEMQEGVEAIEESKEAGEATPRCPDPLIG